MDNTAPQATSTTAQMLVPNGAPALSLSSGSGNNTTADFVVGPEGGVFPVGNHAVIIPARGICNPATSSYGPSTWDSPCTPLSGSIKIHAVVRSTNGRPWIDFSPALRFVPSSNPANWAWVYLNVPKAKNAKDLSAFNVLYAATIGGATIDESIADPTLRTFVDTWNGQSIRRIKHFSGYTSSGNFVECTPGVDPNCYEEDPTGSGGGHGGAGGGIGG